MNSIRIIHKENYPNLLRQIPNPPPHLYIRGVMPSEDNIFLTVVGSRKFTNYGKDVCERLISGLRGLPIVIVSGLAYGIDAIAHQSALANGIKTIAFPGSGLEDSIIYPASHLGLAHKILAAGGALISPFSDKVVGNDWTFPTRNRIMAGISHATLVIEAKKPSGTLITSSHASEFNRNVLTVPGSIFSPESAGPHMLISKGATPITCIDDLVEALGFTKNPDRKEIDYSSLSVDEKKIVEILASPMAREILFEKLNMETSKINTLISLLEMKGIIEEKFGEIRKI